MWGLAVIVEFLVDTGATLSLLNFAPRGSVTDKVCIHGATGQGKI